MAGRKGQAQIQDNVETNEEFESYLEAHQKELICMEVFAEFCGHCLATAFAIRKGKMEIGQDQIAMVKACADNIDALSRFKGKSEPVFLFIIYLTHKLSIYCGGVNETAIVRYKTPDKKAYDLALLFTNPQQMQHMKPSKLSNVPAEKGESVLAAGFPYYNEHDLSNLLPTITSGHVNTVSPSMIQTSCCVQSGFSGGPIFRVNRPKNTVEVIGIIAINVTSDGGACFPYVNMAVPVTVFSELLAQYILEKDETKLKSIENNKEMIQSQWRLMPYRSKI